MKIFTTTNFNIIRELCLKALESSIMIAIIGYPGAGKTIGLEYFSKTNHNVIYIVVRKSMSTKEFYLELLKNTGYEGDALHLSLYSILNLIINRFNAQNNNCLLIIDEAGKFKPGQLEYVHELRDQTKNGLGIILAGPEYFFDNLYEWKKRKVVGIPELFRRIQIFEELKAPTYREIKSICESYGIYDKSIINSRFKRCDNFGELINSISLYLKDPNQ